MRNTLKFSLALLIAITLFSFNTKEEKQNFQKATTSVYADTLTWTLLGKIDYLKKPDKLYGEVMFPVINPKLKSMQGKPIVISGFIIPIDNKNYAISKNVFAACTS